MAEKLQPVRVPSGWRIDWNTLFDLEPTEENARRGYFGGSSLFLATHEQRRFQIDVEWRPEDDPGGRYGMRVVYAPWLRTDRGRRCKGPAPAFREAEVVHEFQTRSRAELVQELETWLLHCAERDREGT